MIYTCKQRCPYTFLDIIFVQELRLDNQGLQRFRKHFSSTFVEWLLFSVFRDMERCHSVSLKSDKKQINAQI
jgi:hypothetical protein